MTFDRMFFKEYFLKPLCFAAVVIIALFVLNKFTYFNISLGSNNNLNSFEVIGTGTVRATPNIATTTYTIEQKGATQQAAKDAANQIQNKALSRLEVLGIKKSDIKTTNFSVNPNYESAQTLIYPPQPQKQNGYVANITVQIQSKDVEVVNRAIDSLSGLGANVGGVSFTFADETSYQMQAQDKAIANAKIMAANMAKAAGFKLGKIVSVRNVDDSSYPQPQQYALRATATEDTGNTDLQPGSNDITARIGVTYYIKN